MCFVPLWQDPGIIPAFKLGTVNKAMPKKKKKKEWILQVLLKEGE